MYRARLPIVALVTGVVALAGCGSDNSDDNGAAAAKQSTPAAGGQSVKLSETEFKITPADPSVKKAGPVTFEVTNDGQTDHALEVEGPSGEAKTETIAPGKSATLNIDLSKAGKYEMYCPIGNHKAMGMKGDVIVAGGGSGSGASDESSDDSGGKSSY
jgi:uncharacterized cupredoxin-like copper-binding protein